jgi:hypothetical protein
MFFVNGALSLVPIMFKTFSKPGPNAELRLGVAHVISLKNYVRHYCYYIVNKKVTTSLKD